MTDRMDDYKSLPLGWIMIYEDRLNRDSTDGIRYIIVQYGILSQMTRTSGQASRFEPAYASMRTLSILIRSIRFLQLLRSISCCFCFYLFHFGSSVSDLEHNACIACHCCQNQPQEPVIIHDTHC